jgi:hypothetical protein
MCRLGGKLETENEVEDEDGLLENNGAMERDTRTKLLIYHASYSVGNDGETSHLSVSLGCQTGETTFEKLVSFILLFRYLKCK